MTGWRPLDVLVTVLGWGCIGSGGLITIGALAAEARARHRAGKARLARAEAIETHQMVLLDNYRRRWAD